MHALKAKFIGGPRHRKTRTLASPKAPAVIEVPEDCRFHNISGRYKLIAPNELGIFIYEWVPE